MHRREFLVTLAAAGAAGALPRVDLRAGADQAGSRDVPLGMDNFSIRSMGWKAPRLIDYAAELRLDVLFLSDLGVYDSFEEPYLKGIRARAEEKGLRLHVGTGSACPTSKSYNASKWGPPEDHLRLLIRVARTLGSPVARCYTGTRDDREPGKGMDRHIEAMVKVCKAVRSEAMEAGIKIAIENHAGDMQAWELAGLIEAAGKEHVGVTMDCGNAVWTMEDPMVNLEILGPYAVTTGMRDTALWENEKGAVALWANMGGGVVDWKAYVKRFRELCPAVPFVLEILSYIWPREIPYLDPKMWDVFPKVRAHEFARFLALVKKGRKQEAPPGRPAGNSSKELEQAQQKYDLEESIRYCRDVLGLGLKT